MNCLNSFRLRHPEFDKIDLYLYDNSINSDSEDFFKENDVPFYSRSEFTQIKYIANASEGVEQTCHAAVVRQMIDDCKSDWLILVDSDTEFNSNVMELLKGEHVMGGKIEYGMKNFTWANFGEPRDLFDRFYAYFMVINVKRFGESFLYFNSDSIWPDKGFTDQNIKSISDLYLKYFNTAFDVGSYAYFQALKMGLPMKYIDGNTNEGIPAEDNMSKYVTHIGSASWGGAMRTQSLEDTAATKYKDNPELIKEIVSKYVKGKPQHKRIIK
jgi:hypothetical protein